MKARQKGFTLIEIIVVLIILGILAAIALPAFFSNIAKSRSVEAILTLKSYKDPTMACVISNNSWSSACLQIPVFSHLNQYTASTANFNYNSSLGVDGLGNTNSIQYSAYSKTDITNFITVTIQGNPDVANPTAVFDCEGVFIGTC